MGLPGGQRAQVCKVPLWISGCSGHPAPPIKCLGWPFGHKLLHFLSDWAWKCAKAAILSQKKRVRMSKSCDQMRERAHLLIGNLCHYPGFRPVFRLRMESFADITSESARSAWYWKRSKWWPRCLPASCGTPWSRYFEADVAFYPEWAGLRRAGARSLCWGVF